MADTDDSAPTQPHTILCLDDEENILFALKRVFRKEPYQIVTFTSAAEAIKCLETQAIDLIISDHRMPEMEGTEFLSTARKIKPDVIRIMLTGYADMQAAVDAINNCQVYRFIAKPWNDDDLRLTVRQALRQVELVTLNRELSELVKQQNEELFNANRSLEDRIKERTADLEQQQTELLALNQQLDRSFFQTIQAFVGVMELKNATLVGHGRRTADLAMQVAAALGVGDQERRLCEAAALLMDIGEIGYPDELLKKSESAMDNVARQLWQKHPLLGETTLQSVERLRPVAAIVRAHHERFDGHGFPDGLRGDQIPLPARILAACEAFDWLVNQSDVASRLTTAQAIDAFRRDRGQRFAPDVVDALVGILSGRTSAPQAGETEVAVGDLTEGMVLARELKTRRGVLLVPAGAKLGPDHLQKILSFHRVDPIGDTVYVRKAA